MLQNRNPAVQLKSHVLPALRGWYFGRQPVLLRSYLIVDGIHLNDTAKSSSVEMGEGRVIEEFVKTGELRSCKILLLC